MAEIRGKVSKAQVRLKYGKRTVKYGKSIVLYGNFFWRLLYINYIYFIIFLGGRSTKLPSFKAVYLS